VEEAALIVQRASGDRLGYLVRRRDLLAERLR
jgi:hypothetical protein